MSKLENMSPHYEEVKLTAGADISDAPLIVAEAIKAFPLLGTILNGEDYAAVTRSPKVKAEKAVGAITPLAALYWDDTAKNVTTTVGANTLIGYANIAAASADTHVMMSFDGSLAFAKA